MRWVIAFSLMAAAGVGAGIDIAFMVCEAPNNMSQALAYFEDDPRFDEVNFYNCRLITPSIQEFLKHDVVFVGGYHLYHDHTLFGNRLADYVDQGGLVVVTSGGIVYYPDHEGIGGRWRSDGYCPYYSFTSIYLEGYLDLIIDQPGHEIFEGVSGLWDSYWRADTYTRSGAVELAHFPDAGGVAVNAAGNVIAANYLPEDIHRWTGDGYLIMANAACWLAAHSNVREMSWGQIKAEFE